MSKREQEAAGLSWYHTMELPDGYVTPGVIDTRDELARVPMPTSLKSMRCLDVGTCDGFWAFEMARRGADEVVAIDLPHAIDWDWPGFPTGNGLRKAQEDLDGRRSAFEFGREAFGVDVRRVETSVYDVTPEQIGQFDFIFAGSILLHLRDPVGALQALHPVTAGGLLSVDAVSLLLTLQHPRQAVARLEGPGWPLWWQSNLAGYRHFFRTAGFDVERSGRLFLQRLGPSYQPSSENARAPLSRVGRALRKRLNAAGLPHSWVLARPGQPRPSG